MDKIDFARLKQEINLPEYAGHLGYELDKKKSTRNSLVMSQEHADKIIISRPTDIWVYFSVYDDSDNGTVIDFAKNRLNKTLFEVGKELENWLGTPPLLPLRFVSKSKESKSDPERIVRLFNYCHPITEHSYLKKRGINEQALKSPRFHRRVFRDQFKNVVFPHLKSGVACGLELVNENMHLFVSGSEKTLWRSNRLSNDNILMLAETPIDAISYEVLNRPQNAFYVSTSGGFSNKQANIIKRLVSECSWIKKVFLIVDNDEGGDRIATRLQRVIRETPFHGKVERHSPQKRGCDWNDVLMQFGI